MFFSSMKRLPLLTAAVVLAMSLSAPARADEEKAADREISLINIKYQGKIMWLPNPLIVQEGENVRLTLFNNVQDDPNVHGFSIPEFGVKANVEREKPLTVEFTASKAGLFETNCHLHPAHLKGQILVLEK